MSFKSGRRIGAERVSRRALLAGLGGGVAANALSWPGTVWAQGTPSLLDRARALAAAPFEPPSGVLPPPFAGLDYNAYRGIRPRAGQAAMLPQGDGFAVDLLPPGLYFPDPVQVERPRGDSWQSLPFAPGLFEFQDRYFDEIPETAPGAGFSGMRLRYPLNAPDLMDEVAVFQGASYFRAIGRGMVYGLSARAIALGTGGAAPEEFPRFTVLRLHDGAGGRIRVEGLIDSPSLAAYLDMTLIPGDATAMDVAVTLFPRRNVTDIGVAPLTSMYLKGPMHGAASDDFRPRVHDSDVLVVENGAGEHLWRPAANPARVETSAFLDTSPRSFGLYQTARRYRDFEDTEARYQDRPSARVTPQGDWGEGAVMLVEIPTGTEFLDNLVAFWRPKGALEVGRAYRYVYRVTWTTEPPAADLAMGVVQSRSGREHELPGTRRFVIDFAGEAEDIVPNLSVQGAPVEAFGLSLFALPDGRGTRVTFLLEPGQADALELRLVLQDGAGLPLSAVWLHRWTRKRDGGV